MSDVLIRSVPDDQLRQIDALAKGMGLTRSDFLRRELSRIAVRREVDLTPADFDKFAGLADAELMRDAWS